MVDDDTADSSKLRFSLRTLLLTIVVASVLGWLNIRPWSSSAELTVVRPDTDTVVNYELGWPIPYRAHLTTLSPDFFVVERYYWRPERAFVSALACILILVVTATLCELRLQGKLKVRGKIRLPPGYDVNSDLHGGGRDGRP